MAALLPLCTVSLRLYTTPPVRRGGVIPAVHYCLHIDISQSDRSRSCGWVSVTKPEQNLAKPHCACCMAGLRAARLPCSSSQLVRLPSAWPAQPLRATGRRAPLQVSRSYLKDFCRAVICGPTGLGLSLSYTANKECAFMRAAFSDWRVAAPAAVKCLRHSQALEL